MGQDLLSDQTLFRPIDASRLGENLNVSEKGRERGARELPESNSALPDQVEAQIIEKIQTIRAQTLQDCQIRLQAINSAIANDYGRIASASLEDKLTPIVSAVEEKARIDLMDLEHTRERLTEQRAHFKSWRQRRQLTRPAKDQRGGMNFFADLFVLAIAEGALNLFFFVENNALGFLGAFLQAFLIAAANILVFSVLGFVVVKRIHSVFLMNKLVGLVGTAVMIIGLPIVHLVVGYYRMARQSISEIGEGSSAPMAVSGEDAMASESLSPLWTAVDWMTNMEFWRLDELSIVMVIIGVVLGAYAARKGYSFGDRYPDYSKAYNDYNGHRTGYLDHLDDVTGGMLDQQKDASEAVDKYRNQVGSLLGSLSAYLSRKKEMSLSLNNFDNQLEEAARLLLAEYHGANKSARSTPAPQRFNEKFEFENPNFHGDEVLNQPLKALLDEHSGVEEIAKQLVETSQNVAREYNGRIATAITQANAALDASKEFRTGGA